MKFCKKCKRYRSETHLEHVPYVHNTREHAEFIIARRYGEGVDILEPPVEHETRSGKLMV